MSTWYVVYTQPVLKCSLRESWRNRGLRSIAPIFPDIRHARSVKRSILRYSRGTFRSHRFGLNVGVHQWNAGVSYIITMNGKDPALYQRHCRKDQRARKRRAVYLSNSSVQARRIIGNYQWCLAEQVGSFLRLDKDKRIVVLFGMLGRNVEVRLQTEAVRAYS